MWISEKTKENLNLLGRSWIWLSIEKLKITLCIFTLSMLLGVSAAYAGTAYSGNTSYTVNGIGFYNYTMIVTDNDSASSWIKALTSPIITLPTGYIGAYSELYKSNGQLYMSSGWSYSSSPTNNWQMGCITSPPNGNYYAGGLTSGYDSSTGKYSLRRAKNSPIQYKG